VEFTSPQESDCIYAEVRNKMKNEDAFEAIWCTFIAHIFPKMNLGRECLRRVCPLCIGNK
jgi:hypothetical protein